MPHLLRQTPSDCVDGFLLLAQTTAFGDGPSEGSSVQRGQFQVLYFAPGSPFGGNVLEGSEPLGHESPARPTWPAINESITSGNTLISALVLTAKDLLVVILSKYFVAKSGTNSSSRTSPSAPGCLPSSPLGFQGSGEVT